MKVNRKILILITVISIIIGITIYLKYEIGEHETYIIPNSYKGEVVIFFDMDSGTSEEYEGNTRIYRIPSNGILKTKFKFNKGSIPIEWIYYFYEDSKTRKKIKLTYIDISNLKGDSSKINNSIYAFSKRYGSGLTNHNNQEVTYTSFLIGNKRDIDSLFYMREQRHILDSI